MTVQELIDKLKEFPPDKEVKIAHPEGWDYIKEVNMIYDMIIIAVE